MRSSTARAAVSLTALTSRSPSTAPSRSTSRTASSAPSNTGIPSGHDLDNNGQVVTTPGSGLYGNDSYGFGEFAGKFGMFDGDSTRDAILQVLENSRINTSITPTSLGGPEQAALQGGANASHEGDPTYDTADFADTAPGNLRADYVLPSRRIEIEDSFVFWPSPRIRCSRWSGRSAVRRTATGFRRRTTGWSRSTSSCRAEPAHSERPGPPAADRCVLTTSNTDITSASTLMPGRDLGHVEEEGVGDLLHGPAVRRRRRD